MQKRYRTLIAKVDREKVVLMVRDIKELDEIVDRLRRLGICVDVKCLTRCG